jgi:hypothetical protein
MARRGPVANAAWTAQARAARPLGVHRARRAGGGAAVAGEARQGSTEVVREAGS